MIIVLRAGATEEDVRQIEETIRGNGLTAHISRGWSARSSGRSATSGSSTRTRSRGCRSSRRCSGSSPRSSSSAGNSGRGHRHHGERQDDRGKALALVAGPCSVEGRDMMVGLGSASPRRGPRILRGGAFKPRTSRTLPGTGEEGLKYLAEARDRTGLPWPPSSWTRGTSTSWPGTPTSSRSGRGTCRTSASSRGREARQAVILKRGMSATIQEWLMSAE